MRFGKSKRSTQIKKAQPKPPPPARPSQQQNNGHSIMGNVIGGAASGFGIGTGIEASRQVVGGIFGNSNEKNSDMTQNQNMSQNQNNLNCNLLMQLIKECKDSGDMYDYNCKGLIKSFEKHCS